MTAADVLAGRAPWAVVCAEATAALAELPAGCVQLAMTSPAYYGLRDYGTATWEGGDDPACDHRPLAAPRSTRPAAGLTGGTATVDAATVTRGDCARCGAVRVDQQIGLEPDLGAYLDRLVGVFRQLRRVLHPTGVLVVNMGDSYNSGTQANGHRNKTGPSPLGARPGRYDERADSWPGHRPLHAGLPPKSLMLVPARLAIRLQEDGWVLRSEIPWVKASSMPESVQDRPSSSVEYVYLFAKGPRYFWDTEAGRVALSAWSNDALRGRWHRATDSAGVNRAGRGDRLMDAGTSYAQGLNPNGRNRRNGDWLRESFDGLVVHATAGPLALVVNPQPTTTAHYAAYPPRLVEPFVRLATPEAGVCAACGSPWRRSTEPTPAYRKKLDAVKGLGDWYARKDTSARREQDGYKFAPKEMRVRAEYVTTGWTPACRCPAGTPTRPALVLDPFAGTSTTGAVALRLGRRYVGIDLSPAYVEMSRRRLIAQEGLPPERVAAARGPVQLRLGVD